MKRAVQPQRDVKVIRVEHAMFGRVNNKKISQTVKHWTKRRYSFQEQVEQPRSGKDSAHTRLTFVKEAPVIRLTEENRKTSGAGRKRISTTGIVVAMGCMLVAAVLVAFPPKSSPRAISTPAKSTAAASLAAATALISLRVRGTELANAIVANSTLAARPTDELPRTAIINTVSASTLDEAGRSIMATQQFFTNQQTQAAGGAVVFTAPPPAPTRAELVSYQAQLYAQGSVNVRECPRRDCALVGFLSGGEAIAAEGRIEGEAVRAGNSVWYHIRFSGREGYVYSEFVTNQAPTAVPVSRPTQPPISVAPLQAYHAVCDGQDNLNCRDFCGHLRDAQAQADACNNEDRLDGGRDSDSLACEETDC